MAKGFKKFLEFFAIGSDYEDEGFEEEEIEEPEYAPKERRGYVEEPEERTILRRKSKIVPVQEGKRMQGGRPASVIIYSPTSYSESQHLVLQLKQNRQVIVKLEQLDVDVAQRILDFMSGAAFSLEAQVSKIAKGIYLFASNETNIEKAENNKVKPVVDEADGFFDLNDEDDRYAR